MDGLALLEQIRGDPSLQKLRVVILSGDQDRTKIISLSKLGISEYLLKPANPVKLRAILRVAAGLAPTVSTPPAPLAATPQTTPATPPPEASEPAEKAEPA
jgi:DNA-binding NarL/FixJ family response regulator